MGFVGKTCLANAGEGIGWRTVREMESVSQASKKLTPTCAGVRQGYIDNIYDKCDNNHMGFFKNLLRLPGEESLKDPTKVMDFAFDDDGDCGVRISLKMQITPKELKLAELTASRILLGIIGNRELFMGAITMKHEGGNLTVETSVAGEDVEEKLNEACEEFEARGYLRPLPEEEL